MTNHPRLNIQTALVTAVLILLTACAPLTKVPIEERAVITVRQQSERMGGQLIRIVQSGDTVYSIAFESNLDVNELAAWNGISDTRRLRVGQRIRLTRPFGFVAKPIAEAKPVAETKPIAKADPSITKPQSKATKRVVSIPAKVPSKSMPDSDLANSRPSVSKPITLSESASSNSKVASNASDSNLASNVAGVSWSWPVYGKVIRRFSPSSTQQGIDILGKDGQAVMASATGEVVYVGNSLKGYGNLIIIKHDGNFLSAYAHNQKVLVKEGQKIAPRQIIGAVGSNNRRETALHFQIRRKGKPVNPLSYLSAQLD